MNPQHVLPQIVLRLWPFPRGAGRIADKLFFYSGLRFEGDIATIKTTDGFYMSVMPNELIGRHLYLIGEFDRSTVEILLKLSKPGDVLLDIGANVGYVSGCFLQRVPRSSVIAVEPQPQVACLLRENLARFEADRSIVIEAAISDADGNGRMQVISWNLGRSSLVKEASANTVEVAVWSARRLLESAPGRINLVKIDVEGHEAVVLDALKDGLATHRPRAVLFEDHTKSAAPGGVIRRIFDDLGYRVFGICKKLTKLKLCEIHSIDECTCNDYVAQLVG